jgi:hypothetical protein
VQSSSQPGTKQNLALDNFINEVGLIYEHVGGVATASYQKIVHTEETRMGSPFTRFVHHLLMLCPQAYQPASEKALAYRIMDLRRKKNKGRIRKEAE